MGGTYSPTRSVQHSVDHNINLSRYFETGWNKNDENYLGDTKSQFSPLRKGQDSSVPIQIQNDII